MLLTEHSCAVKALAPRSGRAEYVVDLLMLAVEPAADAGTVPRGAVVASCRVLRVNTARCCFGCNPMASR